MNLLKLLFGLFAAVSAVTLKDCGNSAIDQAKITGMGFSPENPKPGDATELWIAYDLKSELTSGTATYSVTVNYIPLTPTVEDLCTQTSCPKAIGSYNETSHSTFPSGVSGKIVSKIQWKNQNNEPVWCSQQTFSV
jgi:hypothetical protein